jgi:hypothetical protein
VFVYPVIINQQTALLMYKSLTVLSKMILNRLILLDTNTTNVKKTPNADADAI